MSAADDFNEIATAIMRLQAAMRRSHMEPAVIELASREQGERLHYIAHEYMRASGGPTLGIDAIGRAVRQLEICGTIVRWPAEMHALRKGGFEFR